MADVNQRRCGLRALRSSTNLIDKSFNTSIKDKSSSSIKISPTELNDSQPHLTNLNKSKTSRKSNKLANLTNTSNTSFNTSLNRSSGKLSLNNSKQIIKKSTQSIEKKKVKKAIQTVLSKEQRIKNWLITKKTIEDHEYWRLYSDRLGKELSQTLDRLDELELENELLVAEFEELSKLAKNAYKLGKLFKSIDVSKVTDKKNDSVESVQSD